MTSLSSLLNLHVQLWNGQWMGPGMMGWGYGMGVLGGLMMLVFWVLVIIGLVYLIRWLARSSGHGEKREETALDLLKKRYASGEISKQEFEEKKKDLL